MDGEVTLLSLSSENSNCSWNSLLIGIKKTPFPIRDYMQVPMPVLLCFSRDHIWNDICYCSHHLIKLKIALCHYCLSSAQIKQKQENNRKKMLLYISVLFRVGLSSGYRNTWFNVLVMVHMIFRDFHLALPTLITLILWLREVNWGFHKILIISVSTYCSIIVP